MHIHKWSKWDRIIVLDSYSRQSDAQERECSRCGRVQRRDMY